MRGRKLTRLTCPSPLKSCSGAGRRAVLHGDSHRASGDAALLLAMINASWAARRLPPAWKEADIQPIPKPREPTKLRPISLLSCTAKTAERMVLARLQWRVGPLHPHVFGYTRGVSTAVACQPPPHRSRLSRPREGLRAGQPPSCVRRPRAEGSARKTAGLAAGLLAAPQRQSQIPGPEVASQQSHWSSINSMS